MAAKTNAARLLETAGVEFEVLRYSLPDDEFSAEAVADQLQLDRQQVFKTLVVHTDHEPAFALVPGGMQLDLKRLATVLAVQRTTLAPLADVKRLTGYARGSVTVLGAKRPYRAVIDEAATLYETIAVSGGAAGTQLVLRSDDYVRVTQALVADIAR